MAALLRFQPSEHKFSFSIQPPFKMVLISKTSNNCMKAVQIASLLCVGILSSDKHSRMVTAWHQMIVMTGSSPIPSQGTIIYQKLLLKHQKMIVVLVWSQDVRSMMVPLMIISAFKDPSSITQKSNKNDSHNKLFFIEGYNSNSNMIIWE